MNTRTEYESVDLTEDEDSSEENVFQKDTPLHFVDCTEAARSTSPIMAQSPPQTAKKNLYSRELEHLGLKRIPSVNVGEDTNLNSLQSKSKNMIGKFHSVQIKPPTAVTSKTAKTDSKHLETVCLDSDDEESNQTLPEQQNVPEPYNPTTKHTGKVVVIKKNNKLYKIVIPHNVMPDTSQSVGPVLINIPEVGPLVITMDPKASKTNPTPNNQVKQHILNLDDVQPNLQSVPSNKAQEMLDRNSKVAALCDKKFCWTYIRGRKRDLDGFSSTDRLGFNQAESNRTKKCLKMLQNVIHSKEIEMVRLLNTYKKFKHGESKKAVKLVKINDIVGRAPKKSKKRNTVSDQVREERLKEANDVAPYYDSDLLLTKKVVFLKENVEEGIHVERKKNFRRVPRITKSISKREKALMYKERVKKAQATKQIKSRIKAEMEFYKSFNLKPCYVEMVREEQVEEEYRKHYKKFTPRKAVISVQNKLNTQKNRNIKGRVVSREVGKSKSIVRKKYVPKLETDTGQTSNYVENPQIQLPELPTQESTKQNLIFYNISKMLLSKVINTEERFFREMNLLKPILVVHVHNIRTIDYSEEFSKNNIVYIVQKNLSFPNSILSNQQFVSAVELGYLKLVNWRLFCKFVSGELDVNGSYSKKQFGDHNYCLNKN